MGLWTQSNEWYLEPTQVLNPNDTLIGSAYFAGLTTVTDRQTDRSTDHATRSVTIDLIHARCIKKLTAMRRNNIINNEHSCVLSNAGLPSALITRTHQEIR